MSRYECPHCGARYRVLIARCYKCKKDMGLEGRNLCGEGEPANIGHQEEETGERTPAEIIRQLSIELRTWNRGSKGGRNYEGFFLMDQLRRQGGLEAARAITTAFSAGDDDTVQHAGMELHLMGEHGRIACLEALQDPERAENAAKWLMAHPGPDLAEAARTLMESSEERVAESAARLLAQVGGDWRDFTGLLGHPSAWVRRVAASALGWVLQAGEFTTCRWTDVHGFYRAGGGFVDIKEHWRTVVAPDGAGLCTVQESTGGLGAWEAVPYVREALSREVDNEDAFITARVELTDALIGLLLMHCPPEEIGQHAVEVGELLAKSIPPEKVPYEFPLLEYTSFCGRGNLPLWAPFTAAVQAASDRTSEWEEYLGSALDALRERGTPTAQQHREEVDALYAVFHGTLREINEDWAIDVLLDHRGSRAEKVLLEMGDAALARIQARPIKWNDMVFLTEFGGSAVEILVHVLQTCPDQYDRARLAQLLGEMGDERARAPLKALARMWSDAPKEVREAAREGLAKLDSIGRKG